jgi:hypothetical protein
MDAPPPAVIVVETKFLWLQWVFVFCTPRISIDGYEPERRPWGRHTFTVPPGPHRVEVFVPYMFFTRMGANSVTFQVGPGDVAEVTWKAPWMTLLPGKITTAYLPGMALAYGAQPLYGYGAPPMAAPMAPMGALGPGGWFADPAARHELRYFDGATWTPDVSDAGVLSADPL